MGRRTGPPDPSIGERIKARRDLRGWSIRYAASRAGIDHTFWGRIEKGERGTDRYTIVDMAAALECSVGELTGQPYIPADRATEAAQARYPALWLALSEVAPDEPPSREAKPLAELAARMELLDDRRTKSDYAAVGQILPDFLHDLHAASRGPDARPVLTMMVDAMTTARGTLRGLGRLEAATLASERCRQFAESLGDPVPLAVADWARADTAGGSGSHQRRLTLSARAADELTPHLDHDGALAVLGMLHLSAALATVRSSPADAFAHLDEAGRIAARTGETRRWWHWFGPVNVGIWKVGALVDAGEPGRAVELANGLHVGALDSANRRSTLYVELSRALAGLGGASDDEAIRALLTAERIAPQWMRQNTAARSTARFLRDRARRRSALLGLCERLGIIE